MSKAFVKNAGDKQQVKDAERKVRQNKEQEIEDVRQILSTRTGRRFFWRYMGLCGIFETTFSPHSPNESFFKEGARNVGLKLLADLHEADPEAYIKMVKEAKEADKV